MQLQPRKELQLADYWNILLRRRWLILLFGALVMGTTALGTLRQQKLYLATTVLHIDINPPRVVDFDDAVNNTMRIPEYQQFYNTQYNIINSWTVKSGAIEKLRSRGYKDWDKSVDPVADFGASMQVSPIKETRLVQIGFMHTDPAKAAEIANVIAQVYMEENMNRKLRTTEMADDWLTRQAQSWREKKRESDSRLLEFRRSHDLLAMEERENVFQKGLAEIYEAYNRARTERIASETEFKTLADFHRRGQLDPLVSYFSTETVRTLRDKVNELDRQYASLSERYLPKFPQMIQLDTERKTVRKELEAEIGRLVKGKEADFMLRQRKEASLLEELDRMKLEAGKIEEKMLLAQDLSADSERNERFFKQLDKRQAETDLVGLLKNSNIEVIDSARAPVKHVRPDFLVNMALALLVSLSGGVGLAFAVEYLDKTFKSPDEVEQFLQVPLLGIFPVVEPNSKQPDRDIYVYKNPRSSVAECCRSIRTNVVLGGAGRQIRSLLVTSASPREGKSTLVISLGITMAQANHRTLLVDTDLRRPRLHNAFGLGIETGLTSLFMGTSTYEKAVVQTEIPNLWVLPSGPIPPNPSELLGSPRMKEILAELLERFDMVIFDSPPCIAVTDAVVLAASTDGVILVIKQDSTTREAALEARKRLGEVGENLIGCIMNNIDVERDRYGYRYYYYYHYYGEDSAA